VERRFVIQDRAVLPRAFAHVFTLSFQIPGENSLNGFEAPRGRGDATVDSYDSGFVSDSGAILHS